MIKRAALLLGLAVSAVSPALAQSVAPGWAAETVSTDLNYPWDIERSGDAIIIAEKGGAIVRIEGAATSRSALETTQAILDEGGGGLLGMALAPDFTSSGRAYFYHTFRSDSGPANRVIEARFDGSAWRETAILLDGIPGHRLYNGGRVAIGPDDLLYVTTGWTENPQLPQDPSNLAGKVLRLNLDGSVPADNPFPGSLINSFGHRNPQGIAWNAAGELFVSEHGQSAYDEINLIKPGGNYGWPLVSGDERREGMETPWMHSGGETWAPSGIAVSGPDLLVAALVGRGLYIADKQAGSLSPVFTSQNRIRDVLAAGDDIYVITSNRSPRREGPSEDRLIRLSRPAVR